MIRQRDFSSLRPLIFVICIVYLLVTCGALALTFQLNNYGNAHGGNYECTVHHGKLECGKISSSTVIQVLIWLECVLLLPVIILCMLTLWARSFVERLPGNTPYAIPVSLILMFLLQLVFLIICFAKGYMRHHWKMDLVLFVQSLFALPVAYLFFNLPQINGDSEPPRLRDDRHAMLKAADNRDRASSPLSSKRGAPPAAKPAQPSSGGTAEQAQGSGTGTGTGSREAEEEAGSKTGSKEPTTLSKEVVEIPPVVVVAPTSDPATGKTEKTEMSRKTEKTDKSAKPADTTIPAPRSDAGESESRKKAKRPDGEQAKSKRAKSGPKSNSGSDRLKHVKIVIPPKSKTRSARSGT